MADEVVIRDHAGNEHVFPAGFDPVQAGQIVQQENLKAGRSPLGDAPASVPEGTFSTGFHEGLKKEPVAGGLVGFGEAFPGGLAKGAWDTITFPITAVKGMVGGAAALATDPVGTLTKVRDTVKDLPTHAKKAFDDAIALAQTDPEGWGQAVGSVTGAVDGGILASKIPLKPGIRLAGRGLEAASEHPFAARMAGGSMVGRGILKGDPLTAGTGIALMGAPKLLNKVGRAMREYGGDDLSTAVPSGARTLDVGDTSQLGKGIRVQPPAGTVRPQPTGEIPVDFEKAAAPVTSAPTGGLSTAERAALKKQGYSDAQIDGIATRMAAKAPAPAAPGGVRVSGAPRPTPTAPPVGRMELTVEDAQRGYTGIDRRGATGTSPTGVERRSGAPEGTVAERAAALRAEGIEPPASKPEGAAMVNKAIQDARNGSVRTTPPVKPAVIPGGKSVDEIIALRTEHGAEEAGALLAKDPRFTGLSKTERTNAIRDLAGDQAGLLPSGAQRDIDVKLGKMGPMEAKAYLAKAPNAPAYNYIANRMKRLGLLVDEE